MCYLDLPQDRVLADTVQLALAGLTKHTSITFVNACQLLWAAGRGAVDGLDLRDPVREIMAGLTRFDVDFKSASNALRAITGRVSNVSLLLSAGAVEALDAAVTACGAFFAADGCAIRACLLAITSATNLDSVCSVEGCNGPSTIQCFRCLATSYCSRACQRRHWDWHHSLECVDVGVLPCENPGFGGAASSSSALVEPVTERDAADSSSEVVPLLTCAAEDCSGHGAFVCGGCLSVHYCSRDCQLAHRRAHRKACRTVLVSVSEADDDHAHDKSEPEAECGDEHAQDSTGS
jgi:hypothetical protein